MKSGRNIVNFNKIYQAQLKPLESAVGVEEHFHILCVCHVTQWGQEILFPIDLHGYR